MVVAFNTLHTISDFAEMGSVRVKVNLLETSWEITGESHLTKMSHNGNFISVQLLHFFDFHCHLKMAAKM